MRTSILLKSFMVFASTFAVVSPASISAIESEDVDPMTLQASELYKRGKVQEALDLEARVVAEAPGQWLPHAAMSFFHWQQGGLLEAIAEGQLAVKLAPTSILALTNLAKMEEALGDFGSAILRYETAKKLAPDDPSPWLGLAQSYIASGRTDEGLAVLQDMAAQPNRGFEWYYQLGDKYLQVDKPKLAIGSSSEAVKRASTSSEKSKSVSQLFLALLRDDQLGNAGALKDQVFCDNSAKNCEMFVRTAASLVSVKDPSSGVALLHSAIADLKTGEDSDAFFRLAKVFEAKAIDHKCDADLAEKWLELAGKAYMHAISLDPVEARTHLGLAAVVDRQGKSREMIEELEKAQSIDKGDSLAPYLLLGLKTAQKELTAQPHKTNLSNVQFKVNGLNCGCKISGMEAGLRKIDGVAFVSFTRNKPYQGYMLVDPVVTTSAQVFKQMLEADALKSAPQVPLAGVTFEVVSNESVKSVADAIQIVQQLVGGDVLKFDNHVKPLLPILPVGIASTAATTKTGAREKVSM